MGNPSPCIPPLPILDHESLNLVLDGSDLSHKITGLVGSDAGRDHRARHASCATQSELAGDENVRRILILCKQRQVKKNGQGVAVSGKNHNLGSTAVKRLGGYTGVNKMENSVCGVETTDLRWHPSSTVGSGTPAGRGPGCSG